MNILLTPFACLGRAEACLRVQIGIGERRIQPISVGERTVFIAGVHAVLSAFTPFFRRHEDATNFSSLGVLGS
jgi:hypothetical protein